VLLKGLRFGPHTLLGLFSSTFPVNPTFNEPNLNPFYNYSRFPAPSPPLKEPRFYGKNIYLPVYLCIIIPGVHLNPHNMLDQPCVKRQYLPREMR
jgi:hypothetical protein